ncbi:hypothetical protein [Arcanobacterium pinnipediorum]|uniref:Yip1 domain-containing protein n=1 Tax=Arcanobacterium pinnipediorum TaxID=1503041 RepID=A0ABY5AF07_9ACTO|nr:hypothetical protein [Arcanobacterium pinnipediorum]USR78783.1 hypothetical protein NG665_05150 [Arcanobacterium pinnipediorum]
MSTPDNTENIPHSDQPQPQESTPQPAMPAQPQESMPQPAMPAQPQESMPQPAMPAQPQTAMPQPGYAPGQSYVTAPQGQYPQGYVPQTSQPNPVISSLKNAVQALNHIWHGRTAQLFATISEQRLFGWVIVGTYVLMSGFLAATSVARSPLGLFGSNSAQDFFYRMRAPYYQYFSLNFGEWLYAFIIFLIIGSLSISLRALAIILTLKMRGIAITFTRAMTLYTVTMIPVLIFMPIMFFVILLPATGFTVFLTLVVVLFLIAASLIGELLLYVGINREGRMEKSPVVPYVWLLIAWAVISTILNMLIITSF